MNYNIQLSINDIDYTNYLQIPLIVQYTADETLDVASFSLNFLTQKTPFKPYSIVDILIEQEGNIPTGDIMLLESDNVTEFQCNGGLRYRHDIKAVELTQLLSTYILPDITITQPITAFAFPNAVPSVTEDEYTTLLSQYDYSRYRTLKYYFELTETTYAVKQKYKLDDIISLYLNRHAIVYSRDSYASSPVRYYSTNITYTWFYSTDSGSTWATIPTDWTPATAAYKIKAVMNDFVLYYKDLDSSGFPETSITKNTNQTLIFDVEVVATTGDEDIYSIQEGIEKVLSAYIPREFESDYNFITLDTDIATKYNLDSLKCPEMTITNGRNIFEVMSDIGREFNGIPYLYNYVTPYSISNTKLSFHVLENPADNPTFNDGTELESEEANMTNYSTGLIADVKNMTSAERTKIYPGKDRYISARVDPTEYSLQLSNMSILVDDNIYYLEKVTVKNWLTADSSLTVDITGYIKEKTLYEALNNNADGKGLALYYVRGTNKIVGLGQFANTQSLLGLSPGEYIIERILIDSTSHIYTTEEIKSPLEFQYNIEYVPYIDTRETVFQSNVSDFNEGEDYFLNYNQETSNINAEAFGSSTQKIVSRLGNNDLTKTVFVQNITEIPYVGEHKVVDGITYFANVINVEYMNRSIKLSLRYSKDFNKINNRVGIDKKYREYSLYADSYVNRVININDFCEVSISDTQDVPSYYYNGLQNTRNSYSAFLQSINTTPILIDTFDAFEILPYKSDGTTLLTYNDKATPEIIGGLILPANCNNKGTSINWTASCYDNFSVNQYIEMGVVEFGEYANKDARYVDDVGECPVLGITLANISDYSDDDIFDSRMFPYARYYDDVDIDNYLMLNRKYVINKDNREALRFNYGLHWYTRNKNTTIHRGALKYFYTTNNITDISNLGSLSLVAFRGDIKQKTILQFTENDIISASLTYNVPSGSNSYFYISLPSYTPPEDYDGYALVFTGTGEILYSFKDILVTGIEKPIKWIRLNFINKQI